MLSNTIKQLQSQKTNLEQQIAKLDQAITALSAITGTTVAAPVVKAAEPGKRKYTMSPATLAKMRKAAKLRWVARRAKTGAPAAAPVKAEAKPAKKRKMSAAGLAAIKAAVKARWAKVHAAKAAKPVEVKK